MKTKLLNNNTYLLLIDEKAEIKENTNTFKEGFNGDWFWNSKYNSIQRIGDITEFDFKIIAYYPLTAEAKEFEGLPLLPPFEKDDVGGLAEKESEKHHYAFGQQSEFYQLGFIEGYKTAQSKGQFSLDDIEYAITQAFLKGIDRVEFNETIKEEIIQSLSTQQLPKEFNLGEGNTIEEQLKNGYYTW